MCIIKQYHTVDFQQKPVTYSKSLVHLSKVSIYLNEHISAIRMKSPLFTNNIVKMLRHVVNITVRSALCICMPYIHFKSTHLHITECGILIERDRFKMFELLRIWLISQYLAAPFSHCKVMIDNMVDSSGPYFIWHAPLFLHFCPFLCFASVPFHHASLLLFFLSAVDPDYFLDVHPLTEFVILHYPLSILSHWRFKRCSFELFQRTGLSTLTGHFIRYTCSIAW